MKNNADQVGRVVGEALRDEDFDVVDRYQEYPLRFGVVFADGSIVDVAVRLLCGPDAETMTTREDLCGPLNV